MANKVEFGISNLYVGTYADNNGTITMGEAYHQKGAVSFSPEEQSENNTFYADNIPYYSSYTGGTFEGDLEVAKFDDTFKTQFMGYISKADGGIGVVKNATKPNVYIAFEIDGDAQKRRVIIYNCTLGAINREYATVEDSIEPATETVAVTANGDNTTGLTMVSYNEDDQGYATLFTAPPVPSLT